jgi:hypothetical protein
VPLEPATETEPALPPEPLVIVARSPPLPAPLEPLAPPPLEPPRAGDSATVPAEPFAPAVPFGLPPVSVQAEAAPNVAVNSASASLPKL